MLPSIPTQISVSFKKNIKHSLYFPYTLTALPSTEAQQIYQGLLT